MVGSSLLPHAIASLPMSGGVMPFRKSMDDSSSSLGDLYLLMPQTAGIRLAESISFGVTLPTIFYTSVSIFKSNTADRLIA
jgi:hypothetical protein